jgi:hypothetical protein
MLDKFLLRDTKGKKSVTVTAFIIGFIIVNFKLLFSGVTIGEITLSTFSGVDYGAALAALGAIYVMRRTSQKDTEQ